jgi:cobalt/nickel transport system permease protein
MFLTIAPFVTDRVTEQPMHIPDGFLSMAVSVALWVVAVAFVWLALNRGRNTLGERQVPLTGVLAAFIFSAQMLNFVVAGGTSGHFMGAALATLLVGPWVSVLIMTCVVSVQALLFQDGGLIALGSNITNMAVVGSFSALFAYLILTQILGKSATGLWISRFGSAWVSIVIASLACAVELGLSGTSPLRLALPAMGGVHALIGIGEGVITTAALAMIYASRRDLLTYRPTLSTAGERAKP